MYELEFDDKSLEYLNKHEKTIRKRVFEKLLSTKEDPFRFFKKLTYREGYKLRVGNYRVVADIDKKSKKIKIRLIMHRKNIYEKLRKKL